MNPNWQNVAIFFIVSHFILLTAVIVGVIVFLRRQQYPDINVHAIYARIQEKTAKRQKEIEEVFDGNPEDLVAVGNSFLQQEPTDTEILLDHILVYGFLSNHGYTIDKETLKWVKIEQRTKSEGF